VRDRYKIFIIDEVHQLSNSSFNALLKSIEEPPPHVVFMMATTELHKIPDTIRSRSQEFEFRTIRTRAIIEQLRAIAEAEGLTVDPAALALVARAAEGSMRDAESSLDQVIAFAGRTVTAADVSSVLGLVGRDFLLDIVETVAEEDAARVFDLAAKAVESGQDLRLLCRELARVVRDMMVVTIDPARIDDPEFAPEGDVPRLQAAAARFSREDLLRAFDVIARAEYEVRTSAQPRYHLEMALLRWIHLRKLQPLAEIIEALGRPGAPGPSGTRAGLTASRETATGPTPPGPRATPAAAAPKRPPGGASVAAVASAPPPPAPPQALAVESASPASIRDAFVEQVRQKKRLLHGTLLAQAKRIEVEAGLIRLCFGPSQRVLRKQVDESRAVLEQIAASVTGQPTRVQAVEIEEAAAPAPDAVPAADAVSAADAAQKRLREQALADNAVQAMLDVFPAEIRDVEEIP
jgi:DNA polymerase-3 subunit gamma/tau